MTSRPDPLDAWVLFYTDTMRRYHNIGTTAEPIAQHELSSFGLVLGGDVLDVDANSDYGTSLANFMLQFGGEVNRRTTVLILGDGRGNGHDPHPEALADLARRAREVIWLTPESRYSWVPAGSDMPLYESPCSRVEVVPDLQSLDRMARTLTDAGGR